MWQRFSLYDIRVIGHYLGVLVLFSTIALLVPLDTAIACGEWEPASHYLLTIGISLILGSGLRFLRIEPGRLGRQQALAVTGFAWILPATSTRCSTACRVSPPRAPASSSISTIFRMPTTCGVS